MLAAVLLSTVHTALTRADEGAVAQPELDELDRVERAEALPIGAAIGNES